MATIERMSHEEWDAYSNESDRIASSIMERALPLGVLAPSLERYQQFYGTMGIRHTAQYEQHVGVVTFYLQDDTIQESGTFKSRGAANAVMNTQADHIYAATAGNHGGGVAQACQRLDKQAYIIAPRGAAEVKIRQMERFGAAVDSTTYEDVDAAVPAAKALAEYPGRAFIHPYDDIEVIAGQATAGFDILKNLLAEHAVGKVNLFQDDIQIYVPIGGGGLIAGVASVFRWAKDVGYIGEQVTVAGVQMQGCDAMNRVIQRTHRGEPLTNLFDGQKPNSRCDGTAVANVGEYARRIVEDVRYVDRIMLVSEAQLGAGMVDLHCRLGKRIEPAGALAHAGALIDTEGSYRVPFCSGRNVTDETWHYFSNLQPMY